MNGCDKSATAPTSARTHGRTRARVREPHTLIRRRDGRPDGQMAHNWRRRGRWGGGTAAAAAGAAAAAAIKRTAAAVAGAR